MTNSLLVRASSASLSSSACETAKSPAFDHSIELALQERLACRLGQEGEGLRQHERKGRREQRIEHADVGRGRIFLDPEHRARRGCRSAAGTRAPRSQRRRREVASTS